ncbi:hypothetical protein [Vibrio bathopelagicus]|uniref:hypothetical protein n=1 Tax=Vibrio bathopelagicus TaxID=2777577 RepID=UPI0018655462|nr:hypothetical protein [Vibrio bathopelagicus]
MFLIRYIIRAWGRDELFSVFKFLLWIVALPVLLQSVIYYLFGYHLDFYQYLGGSEPQRAFPFSGDIKYRPGGIFVEPGTHATYLMVMLFIYYGEKNSWNLLFLWR